MKLALPAIKSTLIAITLALNAFSLNAQAALTSYTNAGADLVYSSVSNVTWTKDANLLGSLFASQGFNTVVNNIIAASPTITNTPNFFSPTGSYRITASDFSSNGQTSWFGAMAYVNYLNSINYAGSNQWRLPTVTDTGTAGCNYSNNGTDCGYNSATNGTAKSDELAELYYQELGSKAIYDANGDYQPDYGIQDPDNKFINDKSSVYWSGTEYAPDPVVAWGFGSSSGFQYRGGKGYHFSAWAVSPGQIAAVPEPENVALLLAGLGLMAGVVRRKQKSFAKK
ncbi:DUF1566 domain-containing protein [Methylophilus sp. 13]|uniref:Lcl C-terminal domain-containing protein n=1 Tax=Methylophilus sp. 13 TaxID=2781018 RepID=UPI00188EFC6D|nr:DUF1566 domain-containing protein [Methylophilus sp. 13]MBF5040403.1 DUF1566 domain-containing protein [Methylophilus sp. 13]